jgi:putative oxidoreductase
MEKKSMNRALPSQVRDAALLIARVVLGVVLIAHGWQKVVDNGIGGTAAAFTKMGVPLPPVSATFAAVVELVGGILIVAGAATAIVGLLVVVDMIGAALFVHISNGVFASAGGWELVGVIGATALVLAAAGAGKYSIDHAVSGRTAKDTVPAR